MMTQCTVQHQLHSAPHLDGAAINGSQLLLQSQQSQELVTTMTKESGSFQIT